MMNDSAPTSATGAPVSGAPLVSSPGDGTHAGAGAPAALASSSTTSAADLVRNAATLGRVDSVSPEYSEKSNRIVCKAITGVGSTTEWECTMASTPKGFWQEYGIALSVMIPLVVAFASWRIQHARDRKSAEAARESDRAAAEAARGAELWRANQQIYQRLELASVELFRWEADHTEVTRHFWEHSPDCPAEGTVEDLNVLNYLCQMLNLFEMAVEFRKQRVVPAEVFGSWITWFFKVSQAPRFPDYWQRARLDYTGSLREIMDLADDLRRQGGATDEVRVAFFDAVGEQLECPVAKGWLGAKRTPGDATGLAFSWEHDVKRLPALVQFFVANVSAEYISHSEVVEERAVDFERFSHNLAEVLRTELKKGLKRDGDVRLAVVEKGGKLLGLALIQIAKRKLGDMAWLSDLVVDKSQRNAGVGKHLLDWVEKELTAMGLTGLLLESGCANTSAHRFFERQGFHVVSKVMHKPLGRPAWPDR